MLERLRDRGFEIRFESHAEAILDRDFNSAAGEIEDVLLNFDIPITEIIGSGGGETLGTQRLRRAFNQAGWRKCNFAIGKTIRVTQTGGTGDAVQLERASTTHEVDHVKAFTGNFNEPKRIALEIEWNNKDPFYDRDLENFKRLHDDGAISVGVIITRGASLHDAMYDSVLRYSAEQNIQSLDDLRRLNIGTTPKQLAIIRRQTERIQNPIAFPEAWSSKFVGDKFGEATTHWNKLIARINRGVGNPCPMLMIGLPASIIRFDVNPRVEPIVPQQEPET